MKENALATKGCLQLKISNRREEIERMVVAANAATVTAAGGTKSSEFTLDKDRDLVRYLERRVFGPPTLSTDPVHELKDFYQINPKQLSEMYQMGAQGSLYFITSPHYNQRLSGGYWQHSGSDAVITANWVIRGFRMLVLLL